MRDKVCIKIIFKNLIKLLEAILVKTEMKQNMYKMASKLLLIKVLSNLFLQIFFKIIKSKLQCI